MTFVDALSENILPRANPYCIEINRKVMEFTDLNLSPWLVKQCNSMGKRKCAMLAEIINQENSLY